MLEATLAPLASTSAAVTPHGTFVVGHTAASLVLLDVGTGKGGELPWAGGGAVRVSWDVPGVGHGAVQCLPVVARCVRCVNACLLSVCHRHWHC